jgi:two-component sensor histidine kinase
MGRTFIFLGMVLLLGKPATGVAQSADSSGLATPYRFRASPVFHPASWYPLAQRRLLLQLSSTYYHVYKNADIDLDTTLIHAARYLGLPRLTVINEAFEREIPEDSAPWFDGRDPGAAVRALATSKGLEHLRLLTLLGLYYAFQPDPWINYKDSAAFYLEAASRESQLLDQAGWHRQTLCFLGKLYIMGDQPQRGVAYFNECVAACRTAGDKALEAKAWAWRGLYTRYAAANTNERIDILQRAREIYRETANPQGEANTLTNIGYLLVSALQLPKAREVFLQALQLEDTAGFAYTHYTTDDIAMVGTFEGRYGEPLGNCLLSVKTAEALKDSLPLASIYSRMSDMYGLLDDKFADSRKWAWKSVDRQIIDKDEAYLYTELAKAFDWPGDRGEVAAGLARIRKVTRLYPPFSATGLLHFHYALAKCFEALQQYDSAEKHAWESARLEKQIVRQRGTINTNLSGYLLANSYLREKEYAKAKRYFRHFVTAGNTTSSLNLERKAELSLAGIDSAAGDYRSGMRHLQSYIQLQDSNLTIQGQRLAEDIAVKYETEKKENEIQIRGQHISLLQQADELRQTRLRQAELTRNMTIAGIVLLSVILILLYGRYRIKNRANKKINEQNVSLQGLLNEKDWLVREIHHRVKNNLQIVMSLLNSQSAYLTDEGALSAIRESQNRVQAIALLHQKLYQSENLAVIDMPSYVKEVTENLAENLDARQRIDFEVVVAPHALDVSQAVPLGLIINEAITNAIKYAFPKGNKGYIRVSMETTGDGSMLVSIYDNGIGLPDGYDTLHSPSLGMSLMKGLSKQLDGEFSLVNQVGLTVQVRFTPVKIDHNGKESTDR